MTKQDRRRNRVYSLQQKEEILFSTLWFYPGPRPKQVDIQNETLLDLQPPWRLKNDILSFLKSLWMLTWRALLHTYNFMVDLIWHLKPAATISTTVCCMALPPEMLMFYLFALLPWLGPGILWDSIKGWYFFQDMWETWSSRMLLREMILFSSYQCILASYKTYILEGHFSFEFQQAAENWP